MSTFKEIDAEAEAHIARVDQQTIDALALVSEYMPTIEALASLLAPYYTLNAAEYTATKFDQSGISKPTFDELSDTDEALKDITAQKLNDLNAGSNGLYPGMKAPIDVANTEFAAIWNAIKDAEGIAFKEDDFVAEIITDVQTRLISALGDQPGSSTASEALYYSRDAQRRNAARLKEQRDTLDEFASRGFRLPQDVLADLGSAVQQRQGMDEADRARTVIMQQSTLSQDNKTRAIDAGLRYNQILVTYFDRKMQRALLLATSGLKVIQDLADMKFYVLREYLGVQREYFSLISENQRLIFDEFDQNAKAFAARMDTLVAQAGSYLDAYGTDGQVYAIRQRSLNENRKFVQSESEISMDVLRWNLAQALKAFADNIRAFEATAKIRMGSAAAGAGLQIGVVSAAQGSIMTIVGLLANDKTIKAG
jgi:hypothetical protein